MKVLWLGMVATNEMFAKMPIRTIGQASAHAAQNSILNGFDNNGISVDTISAHNYPPFPIFPYKYVKEENWSRFGKSKDRCVGFWNIKYFSHLSKSASLIRALQDWLNANAHEDKIHIIIYSLHSPFLVAANYAKIRDKRVNVHLIVPDLPHFVDMGANSIKKILKKIDWVLMKLLFKHIDNYILFTKQMADFMRINNKNWIVVEGSVNESELVINDKNIPDRDENKVVIMYAGAIDKYRGIIELIEAFHSIEDNNYELWLTGSGSADLYVKEMSEIDNRIKHFGYFPDRKKIIELESRASILINIRLPEDEVSKFTFPSKLFEYMASGKPVISIRTQGIPDEYFEFITELKSMEKEDVLESINYIIKKSKEERVKYGERAKKFVLQEKNQNVQARKIIDFILK